MTYDLQGLLLNGSSDFLHINSSGTYYVWTVGMNSLHLGSD